MQVHSKRTIPLPQAITLMVLIAIAGAVAFYTEHTSKARLLADKEQAMERQKSHVLAVYDQIEKNLASIREHETMISRDFSGPENTGNLLPEEKIQNEIDFVKNLIDQNNRLIAGLNDQIDQKDTRIAKYQESIRDYEGRVVKYQEQLSRLITEKEGLQKDLDKTIKARDQLTEQVNKLDSTVTQKDGIIADREQLIMDQEAALHTAYYRIDTYKKLRDEKILEKEGGVLGINSVTTLSDKVDKKLFEKIDTRDIYRIPIAAKHWDIVTLHDPSSYEISYESNSAEWLNITDPDKFWSKSQYLVIVVRDKNDELASSR